MSETDRVMETLDALEAPRFDPGFRAAVMTRVARRRLAIETGLGLAGLILAAGLLALAGRELGAALSEAVFALRLPLAVLALVGLTGWIGHRWLARGLKLPGNVSL